MSSIEYELAVIETELNKLSANQAPSPGQIVTFTHSTPAAGIAVTRRASFIGGVKLFTAYLSDASTGYYEVSVSGNVATFTVWGGADNVLTVVSLGEFSLA